jgi:DNA-directed RNA polymerase subunit RPC12/RpoP
MDAGRTSPGIGRRFRERSAAAAAERVSCLVFLLPFRALSPFMENHRENESADVRQHTCSQCGAKVDFAPGTSALKCPYCGYEMLIAQSEAPVVELDYQTFLDKAGAEKESSEAQRIQCNKCGAETTMPAASAAGVCPFCGANMVFSGSVSRLIKPEALLPFKIAQKDAFESFRRWIKGLWFAPGKLKQYAQSENKLAGVYIPYWTYDSDTTTVYSGARGDYYYTTESYTEVVNGRSIQRTRQVRHTRWSPASGTVRNSFDDILILASKSLPTKRIERLEPWDLANLVPYADEYLSGFRAESYQISLPEGFEAAKEVMSAAIQNSIRQDIGGDEQQIHSTQTRYGSITFKHILLPVWLSAYRFRDKVYRILINARTGETQGERPFSAWKIAGAAMIALVILGTLIIIGSSK